MAEEQNEKQEGAAEASSETNSVYHLSDGIILSIGTVDSRLVDLERDYEIRVDYRYVDPLERTTLGWNLQGYEAFVPRLVEENILSPGKPQSDPVIKKRLEALDRMYLQCYEHALSERARHAYELLVDAHGRRKRFFERVGQCPVLPETALRRALLVGDAEQVGVKDVLCVGDDDLVSVALAALGHRVTVFDIDDYLLNFLRAAAKELDLPIRVVERDLRDPIVEKNGNGVGVEGAASQELYDVFMTDPMSNKDCFEIFLSRAFGLLREGGEGYVAVYGPVSRLFSKVAQSMAFEVENWMARHNRYYSKYMKLHDYESDWVKVRKTEQTRLLHPPDEYSVPLNLYREEYHQRFKSMMSFFDHVEELRFATPLYLLTLLDALEGLSGVTLVDRIMFPGDDWTLIHCPMREGYLTLHVDRSRQQLSVDLYPFDPPLAEQLRNLLLAAYKSQAESSSVSVNRAAWDVRVG